MGSSTYKKRKLKNVTVLVLGKGAFERHKCDIRTSTGKRYHFDLMLRLEENMTFNLKDEFKFKRESKDL